jgi:hypothetical protein
MNFLHCSLHCLIFVFISPHFLVFSFKPSPTTPTSDNNDIQNPALRLRRRHRLPFPSFGLSFHPKPQSFFLSYTLLLLLASSHPTAIATLH